MKKLLFRLKYGWQVHVLRRSRYALALEHLESVVSNPDEQGEDA